MNKKTKDLSPAEQDEQSQLETILDFWAKLSPQNRAAFLALSEAQLDEVANLRSIRDDSQDVATDFQLNSHKATVLGKYRQSISYEKKNEEKAKARVKVMLAGIDRAALYSSANTQKNIIASLKAEGSSRAPYTFIRHLTTELQSNPDLNSKLVLLRILENDPQPDGHVMSAIEWAVINVDDRQFRHDAMKIYIGFLSKKYVNQLEDKTKIKQHANKSATEHEDEVQSLEEKIEALFTGLPESYEARLAELSKINHICRQQFAEKLAPKLNAKIQGMEQGTLDQKKAICDFVEKALEPLGLAARVPNTPGFPGKLKAIGGHWPGVGRFAFEVYIDGKRERPAVSDMLPELELTDATAAIDPETPWQKKVGPKSGRHGRKLS